MTQQTAGTHTPGPWRVSNGGKGNTAVVTDREWPKGNAVCLVADPPCHDGEGFPLSEDVVDANARLIAAAPALLEALEKLVELAEPHTTFTGLKRARAVIALATPDKAGIS